MGAPKSATFRFSNLLLGTGLSISFSINSFAIDSQFLRNPVKLVEKLADAASSTRLLGEIRQNETGSRFDGDRCEIRFRVRDNSPWRNGAPHYSVYNLEPTYSDGNGPDEIEYRSSNMDRLHYSRRSYGSRVRVWTRSGLIITARTGYLDLNFDKKGRLFAATYGAYDNFQDQEVGRCKLDNPFRFE